MILKFLLSFQLKALRPDVGLFVLNGGPVIQDHNKKKLCVLRQLVLFFVLHTWQNVIFRSEGCYFKMSLSMLIVTKIFSHSFSMKVQRRFFFFYQFELWKLLLLLLLVTINERYILKAINKFVCFKHHPQWWFNLIYDRKKTLG